MSTIHATCIAVNGHGVLLRGPSGSGKSDLALRLIDAGATLVADDQVALTTCGGRLHAAPPPTLRGLIEVRGIGIVTLPFVGDIVVALAVTLVSADAVARLPEPETIEIDGVVLPHLPLAPFEASAAAKLRLALAQVTGP